MTGPVIAVAWQSRFVDGKWSECSREHVEWVRSVPHEWPGYEVRELYAAPQPAPAIDLERYGVAIQYAINGLRETGGQTDSVVARKLESLLALIDGQADPLCVKKLADCQYPKCGCSDQPTKGEGE